MKPTMTTAAFREEQTRTMSEAEFQDTVILLAKGYGWKVAHFRGVRVQRANGSTYYQTPVQADGAGFPDLVLVRGNRLVFSELKRENGKPTPAQEDWISALDLAQAAVYVWRPRDLDAIHQVLK